MTPKFEANVIPTLDRLQATFTQRGTEYGDTWGNCQFITMKAVAKKLGYDIKPEHYRAICTAGFVDMKYQRSEGGYKDDSLIDGMAYMAFLSEEMRQLESNYETSTRTLEEAADAVSKGRESHTGTNGVCRSSELVHKC